MLTRMTTTGEKKKKATSVGEDIEELDPLCTVGGTVRWYSHMENSILVPQ